MFSLARERFIAFKREAYEIDSLSNIIRGLSLALAAISFAMLMLATALSEQFADPLLA